MVVSIGDLRGGILDARNREMLTVLGKARKAVVIATILETAFVAASDEGKKSRASFVLDDGTAVIKATWFGVGQDVVKRFVAGDIVVALVSFSEYKNEVNYYIDRLRQVSGFNEELHHRASILKRKRELVASGKPLVLVDAGTITNRDDESQIFFTDGADTKAILDSFETPIDFKPAKEEFTPVGRSRAVEDSFEEGFDDEMLKGMIMDTLIDLDSTEGVSIDELHDALQQDRGALVRILRIMENEQAIRRVSSNPDTYRLN